MGDEKYLAALRTYWKRHQAFPSMAKLCDVVGLTSTSSASRHRTANRPQHVADEPRSELGR